MTNKKVVEKKAIVESTDLTESSETATVSRFDEKTQQFIPIATVAAGKEQRGDYTKYFYKNIDRLWDAVESLQRENDVLNKKLQKAQVVFAEGV